MSSEIGTNPIPRFWLYAEMIGLVCQWCDVTLFRSVEDADFADLERAVQGHTCETERKEAT